MILPGFTATTLAYAAAPAPIVAYLASSTDSSSLNFVSSIASTGIVGIVLLMIIFRLKIMPTYVFDEACKVWERDRAEKDTLIEELKSAVKEANSVYTQQVIPTLTRALDAERELVELRRDERDDRRRNSGGG